MKEKLKKTGLKKKDFRLRKLAISVTCLTFVSAALLIPFTVKMMSETNSIYKVNEKEDNMINYRISFDN